MDSEMALGTALELEAVMESEIISKISFGTALELEAVMETEIISKMFMEMDLEVEMASGMASERTSIWHISFDVIHVVCLVSLLLCLLFLFKWMGWPFWRIVELFGSTGITMPRTVVLLATFEASAIIH